MLSQRLRSILQLENSQKDCKKNSSETKYRYKYSLNYPITMIAKFYNNISSFNTFIL
jgi:hypothetical protein